MNTVSSWNIITYSHRCTPKYPDLGCNVCILGVLLRYSGYRGEYIGVDSNRNALNIAEKNLLMFPPPFKLIETNLRDLGLPDRSFEFVVLKDVLEHMEDFKPILGEVLRVSSAFLLISNFIPWTEGETIIRKEGTGFYHNLYSRRDVYQFIIDNGFKVISVKINFGERC